MTSTQKNIAYGGIGVLVSLIALSVAKKSGGKSLSSSFRNWHNGNTRLQSPIPRGIRNNNPGNLVKTSIAWNGKVAHSQNTDSRFEQFVSPEYGVRALIKDITNDIKKGKNTVTKVISEFAPFFENNTKVYIKSVSASMGVSENTILTSDYNTLKQLAMAIDKHENGGQYITSGLFARAWALI